MKIYFICAKVINVVAGANPPFRLSDLKGKISARQYNMLTNPYVEVNPVRSVHNFNN